MDPLMLEATAQATLPQPIALVSCLNICLT